MNPAFWLGKRVFLTGHTGFKGSWLCLWLQSLGAQVTGYALSAPSQNNLFEIAHVERGMSSVIGDIRELATLEKAMLIAQPDIIFHMAAQPLVRYGYEHPVETYSTNVMGTVHLLEAARQTTSVRAIVNVTSDKCYENEETLDSYDEKARIGGFDPYSNSKGCAELVSAAYRSSFFNPDQYAQHGVAIATARAGNVIGGGDWARDRLVPDILEAFSQSQHVTIRSPHAIRPWQHVLEALSGYLTLAENLHQKGVSFSGGWNFGPDNADTQTVAWVVTHMASLWGHDAQWQVDETARPHEAHLLKLDISKARNRLNWQPRLDLSNALSLTLEWYRHHQCSGDMRAVTLDQIQTYQKKCHDDEPH
jgi:CDP-glucose 4,6-dehydratase